MSIDAKIFAALSPLVSVFAADALPMCYPDILKQGATKQAAFKAITYQVIASTPGPLTQLASVNDFRVQITLHAADYDDLLALRAAVITALRAMPEFETYDEIGSGGFEFEPKAFNRILDVHFRDTES